jgi:hypothetical protein
MGLFCPSGLSEREKQGGSALLLTPGKDSRTEQGNSA